jgi:hypothetical protein
MAKEKESKRSASDEKAQLIAKKDFRISHNGFELSIKAGDDISNVPVVYHQNLKTEGVI